MTVVPVIYREVRLTLKVPEAVTTDRLVRLVQETAVHGTAVDVREGPLMVHKQTLPLRGNGEELSQ